MVQPLPDCFRAPVLTSLLVLALPHLLALDAAAQPAQPPVALQQQGCGGLALDAVAHIATLELGREVGTADDAPAGADLITVRCGEEGGFRLVLEPSDPDTAPLDWALEPTDVTESAVPRWLALEIAELVSDAERGRREQVGDEEADATDVVGPAADEPNSEVDTPAEPGALADGFELALVGSSRTFVAAPHQTLGGALLASWPLLGPLVLNAELGAQTGTESLTVGEARLVTFSGLAGLGAYWPVGRWRLEAALGWRAGGVWVSAELATDAQASAPDPFSGLWGGPALSLAADLALSRPVGLRAGFELGWTAWSVGGLVGEAREIDVDGVWLGVSLGLSVRP